ncbi:probable inactive peptidyl-prolyl cis-trans isomerase-like 6 [Ambystoma mexicanum]|uniref:probable inactive peptidyl-prolyl cis-trans isomerase-like 6 n=1 Tax=Ambystoma mexicanum TaxID=8296 RepID=UPI0037E77ACC
MSCEVTCPPAPVCTEPLQVQVVGLMRDPAFHMATWVAQTLRLSFPSNFAEPLVNPLLEFSWNEFLQEKKKELKGETWGFSSTVMCLINGHLLGDNKDLATWAKEHWGYQDLRPLALYTALAEDFSSKRLKSTQNAFVYMDISIGDEPAGRLLFELFCKMCPKTCQNFQALCTSPAGTSSTDLELNYKGTIFHRIVKKGWIQGGGIPCGIGDENESIFGGVFEDESFAIPHNKRGVLGMANKGHHSNGSQFYITLQATPYMDRKYVAFGQLIEGSEVLQKLEALPTINERPRSRCLVADCGIYIP